jgi:hypothetical protein
MNTINFLTVFGYLLPTVVNFLYTIIHTIEDWKSDSKEPIMLYRKVTLGYILLALFFTFTPIINAFYFLIVAAPEFFSEVCDVISKILTTPLNRTKHDAS